MEQPAVAAVPGVWKYAEFAQAEPTGHRGGWPVVGEHPCPHFLQAVGEYCVQDSRRRLGRIAVAGRVGMKMPTGFVLTDEAAVDPLQPRDESTSGHETGFPYLNRIGPLHRIGGMTVAPSLDPGQGLGACLQRHVWRVSEPANDFETTLDVENTVRVRVGIRAQDQSFGLDRDRRVHRPVVPDCQSSVRL